MIRTRRITQLVVVGGPRQKTRWGMTVPGESIQRIVGGRCALAAALMLAWVCSTSTASAQGLLDRFGIGVGHADNAETGTASIERRREVLASLPMQRLTVDAQQRILSIANSPTIFRQLPTQAIDCDRDLFLLIARNPEILVGMWDVMGVTQVTTKRIAPYQLDASDGSGTQCIVDLVYGDSNLHIYVADGSYDGKLVASPIKGRGVFVFRSTYAKSATGETTVTGTLDCFVQLDSLSADLIARTFSGFIGRSADHNFVETARFLSQISAASQHNPRSMIDLANRLPQVPRETKQQFVEVIKNVNRRQNELVHSPRQPRTAAAPSADHR
ncbi:hypothetical protein SH528x_000318 [Novipirellula sp. SH528]|uniref:hypothetical protein n=1 Tax=Novipirellula sp. SH528 TaxID=3454466 RepID=UPI003F9EF21B